MSKYSFDTLRGKYTDSTGFRRRFRTTDFISLPNVYYPDKPIMIPKGFVFDANTFGGPIINDTDLLLSCVHDFLYEYRVLYRPMTREEADFIVFDILSREEEPGPIRDRLLKKWLILTKWWAQPALWVAWRLRIGGFHNFF